MKSKYAEIEAFLAERRPPKPSNKIGRNDPCWCRSGKKYKHCHKDRASQARPNPYEFAAQMQKLFTEGRCLHPDASPPDLLFGEGH
jgi:hypothetical protein